jgi:hypothetical protein
LESSSQQRGDSKIQPSCLPIEEGAFGCSIRKPWVAHFLLDDVSGEGQNTNMIYYPPCPEPSNAFGVKPHSDPNTITILTQDEVGGLEVREKHGEWIQVKPTPYAFIVNVGDQLEVRV